MESESTNQQANGVIAMFEFYFYHPSFSYPKMSDPAPVDSGFGPAGPSGNVGLESEGREGREL